MAAGRQWYVHSIFTVKSIDNSIGKRSVEQHSLASSPALNRLSRQAISTVAEEQKEIDEIGKDKGTNIKWLALNTNAASSNDVDDINIASNLNVDKGKGSEGGSLVIPIAAVAAVLAMLLVVIVVIVVIRRKHSDPKPVTVVAKGGTRVVATGYTDDNTEV